MIENVSNLVYLTSFFVPLVLSCVSAFVFPHTSLSDGWIVAMAFTLALSLTTMALIVAVFALVRYRCKMRSFHLAWRHEGVLFCIVILLSFTHVGLDIFHLILGPTGETQIIHWTWMDAIQFSVSATNAMVNIFIGVAFSYTWYEAYTNEKNEEDQQKEKQQVESSRFQPSIGVALSGGGIRACAEGTGVLKALFTPSTTNSSTKEDVPYNRYLSAVSGGSWALGAFLHYARCNPTDWSEQDNLKKWANHMEKNSNYLFKTSLIVTFVFSILLVIAFEAVFWFSAGVCVAPIIDVFAGVPVVKALAYYAGENITFVLQQEALGQTLFPISAPLDASASNVTANEAMSTLVLGDAFTLFDRPLVAIAVFLLLGVALFALYGCLYFVGNTCCSGLISRDNRCMQCCSGRHHFVHRDARFGSIAAIVVALAFAAIGLLLVLFQVLAVAWGLARLKLQNTEGNVVFAAVIAVQAVIYFAGAAKVLVSNVSNKIFVTIALFFSALVGVSAVFSAWSYAFLWYATTTRGIAGFELFSLSPTATVIVALVVSFVCNLSGPKFYQITFNVWRSAIERAFLVSQDEAWSKRFMRDANTKSLRLSDYAVSEQFPDGFPSCVINCCMPRYRMGSKDENDQNLAIECTQGAATMSVSSTVHHIPVTKVVEPYSPLDITLGTAMANSSSAIASDMKNLHSLRTPIRLLLTLFHVGLGSGLANPDYANFKPRFRCCHPKRCPALRIFCFGVLQLVLLIVVIAIPVIPTIVVIATTAPAPEVVAGTLLLNVGDRSAGNIVMGLIFPVLIAVLILLVYFDFRPVAHAVSKHTFLRGLMRIAAMNQTNWKDVDVSDGGHIENLGAIELLRRRCCKIFCFDFGEDPTLQYDSLLTLIRLAQENGFIDKEVLWGEDLQKFVGSNGTPKSRFVQADENIYHLVFTYLNGVRCDFYLCKATLANETLKKSKTDPPSHDQQLQLDAQNAPAFPNHPTSDQNFDKHVFHAYRRLGEQLVKDLREKYPNCI